MAAKEKFCKLLTHVILLLPIFQVCLGGINLQEQFTKTHRDHLDCSLDPDICRNVVSRS